MSRVELIRDRLTKAFAPSVLEIHDDSEQHKGHAGSQGGAGHYTVMVSSDVFNGLTRIQAHQKIYAVLIDLIPHEIHALRIQIVRT